MTGNFSSESKNLRKIERVNVHGAVKVVDAMRELELGKLVNLHEEGFLLITNESIEEGSIYQLKFLPLPPVNGVDEIPVGAECLWVGETGTGEQLWAGFHIIDIAQSGLTSIHALIEQFPLGN